MKWKKIVLFTIAFIGSLPIGKALEDQNTQFLPVTVDQVIAKIDEVIALIDVRLGQSGNTPGEIEVLNNMKATLNTIKLQDQTLTPVNFVQAQLSYNRTFRVLNQIERALLRTPPLPSKNLIVFFNRWIKILNRIQPQFEPII